MTQTLISDVKNIPELSLDCLFMNLVFSSLEFVSGFHEILSVLGAACRTWCCKKMTHYKLPSPSSPSWCKPTRAPLRAGLLVPVFAGNLNLVLGSHVTQHMLLLRAPICAQATLKWLLLCVNVVVTSQSALTVRHKTAQLKHTHKKRHTKLTNLSYTNNNKS